MNAADLAKADAWLWRRRRMINRGIIVAVVLGIVGVFAFQLGLDQYKTSWIRTCLAERYPNYRDVVPFLWMNDYANCDYAYAASHPTWLQGSYVDPFKL